MPLFNLCYHYRYASKGNLEKDFDYVSIDSENEFAAHSLAKLERSGIFKVETVSVI